jgi:hypothetical protein
MALFHSPKTSTDGLVFMYDTGNRKSYRGEPTTNIVPTPEANSRFTTSNNWYTYNTNQYNSNTFFSIGTVSSVSNNIVTLGTVGRNIRSFDVLRPETTGGGVTAGTDYVIKKLSSTTFSLHEYNNSQNGSQGYINPDTNFFKVHDAYANDTRISINATDFPTSWWGAPHLPNSGLIKEIVEGGGRVKGTNAMRLHVYREDNVADGMAYGVYCPVTAGDLITISVYLKRADDRGSGKTLGYSTYFGSGNSASSTTFGSLTTEWKRYTYSWTASTTFNFYSYWWPSSTSSAYAIDMCDFQVEINGHATPYVVGTRSATQGLLDRTGNSTIDISNASFDSNAQMTFDGTDDDIDVGTGTSTSYQRTIEMVFKTNSLTSYTPLACYTRGGGQSVVSGKRMWLGFQSNKFQMHGWGTTDPASTTTIQTGKYYHAVYAYDQTTKKHYIWINGLLENNATNNQSGFTGWNSSGDHKWFVGGDPDHASWFASAGRSLNGEIPIFKVYDKILSNEEVLQNFNAIKSRFNL